MVAVTTKKRPTKEEAFQERMRQLVLDSAPRIWEQALEWDRQLDDWRAAHPRAAFNEPWQWMEAEHAFEKANRIPRFDKPGRLREQSLGPHSWFYVKLPSRSEWGSYVLLCRCCRKLQLVHHPATGAGACHECRQQELAERAAVKAEKRKVRDQARSAELANRKGLCLVCRSEMTVARGTRLTCSDRCRKQWIRKGAEAFPLPEVPATVHLGQQELPLADALKQLQQAIWVRGRELSAQQPLLSGYETFAAARDGDKRYQQLQAASAQVRRLQELHQLRAEAPAVFLYECETYK